MAGKEKFVVRMTTEEREGLERLVSAGKSAARKLLRARILLKADEDGSDGGWTDERIAQALDTACPRFIEFGENSWSAVWRRRCHASGQPVGTIASLTEPRRRS
jgi:hypothetical protein